MASSKHIVRRAKAARAQQAKPGLLHRAWHSKTLRGALAGAGATAAVAALLHRRFQGKAVRDAREKEYARGHHEGWVDSYNAARKMHDPEYGPPMPWTTRTY